MWNAVAQRRRARLHVRPRPPATARANIPVCYDLCPKGSRIPAFRLQFHHAPHAVACRARARRADHQCREPRRRHARGDRSRGAALRRRPGLDSIDALELALEISKRYGFQLRSDDEENRRIFASLRSLSDYIQKNRTT
ncbi:MAG TPA: phosphopantetheine-binding protein [Steroidobacteraceae bacterium]|nr:phosphopantetheine-binding protein [Steroidobacteraceae bacterium]